ncbi:hypothetical protein OPQ81_008046 [Rhizoctonia solani]|nr:hypothetical protein OPQ81_008046 [Rhizoctonia solani]
MTKVGEIIQHFKNARFQYCASLKQCSASTAAKPTEFAKQQKCNNYMLNGRPRQHTGSAILLYHPVFGNFLSNLQSSDSLPPKFYELIFDYFCTSQEIYDETRDSRGSTSWDASIRLGLEDLLDKLWKISEPGALHDVTAVGSSGSYCLILEIKKRDWHCRVWQSSKLLNQCFCPSILIAIAGPWMCILGAVFFDRPIVQPLTDFIWVGINPSKPREVSFVARVFHSVLKARRELETYYANLTGPATLENVPAPSVPLPYLTHFIDDDGHRVEFTYTIHVNIMSVEPASHLKHSAPHSPPTPIVVKFVEGYNVDAHKLLAKEGLAPKLLYDGTIHTNDQLGPDYSMIVMEYIYGIDLGCYAGLSLPLCVSDDIDRALSLLHAQDLVFGDLRAPNIMLAMDGDGKVTGAWLIDFDWCGKHQVDRYPFDMNKNIPWASGVGPGALLDKRHDIEMRKSLPYSENNVL